MVNWFNSDWKNYLEKGDKIEAHIQPSSSAVILFILSKFSILFILGICYCIVDNKIPDDFFVIIGIVVLCFILYKISSLYAKSIHYVITNKGVYSISGLIYKQVKFVSYNRITDACISRGIIGHLYNVSSIGISTASTNSKDGEAESNLSYIYEYNKIRQTILKKIK